MTDEAKPKRWTDEHIASGILSLSLMRDDDELSAHQRGHLETSIANLRVVQQLRAREKERNRGTAVAHRLLICGGREFTDGPAGFAFLDRLVADRHIALVIEGGARGGDAIGRAWVEARGIEVLTFYADWASLGRKAGPIRNHAMLTEGKPTMVAALPGGKGTAHMVSIAREAGSRWWRCCLRRSTG